MRRVYAVAGVAAAAVGVVACAAAKRISEGDVTVQDVQKAAEVVKKIGSLTEEIRPDQEYWVGRSVATNILAKEDYRYLDKDAIARGELEGMTRYVNYVGDIVAAAAMEMPYQKGDRPAPVAGWHFIVLDDDTINGVSAPGGFVFVTKGAVKLARSEDELACLLAHEIAHVKRGHALGSIKKSRYANVSVTCCRRPAPRP